MLSQTSPVRDAHTPAPRTPAGAEETTEASRLVGTAVGLLMARYSLSSDAAFHHLVHLSHTSDVTVDVIARDLVAHADLTATIVSIA
jgi:AmiR/NasT family two-component response regulator